MNNSDIVRLVKETLEQTFQEPVYMDRLPKDFARPSFAVELAKTECVDLNFFIVRKTATVLITGFVAVDAYHDSSRDALNLRQDQVMDLFAVGRLRVGGIYPTITANKGTGSPDFFEVQLEFSWNDERPGSPEPEAPMMEHYILKEEANGND